MQWIHTLHHTFHHQALFLHHLEELLHLCLHAIVVNVRFHHVDLLILIADTDVLLTVMIITRTIIEVADIEMTTTIVTEMIAMNATIEVTIEVTTATTEITIAMVALRLAMAAPLLEADQEDQFTGE